MYYDGPPIIPIRLIFSDPPSFRCPTSEFRRIIKFARRANVFPDSSTERQRWIGRNILDEPF